MSYDRWRLMNEEEDRAWRESHRRRSWEDEVDAGFEPEYEPEDEPGE
jgi:hypothetical protein